MHPSLLLPKRSPPGLWHLAKANEPNEDFYREVAARVGGRWLVRSNLRGKLNDAEPSSHAVLNIGELAVPGWDHAPYKVRKGRRRFGLPAGQEQAR